MVKEALCGELQLANVEIAGYICSKKEAEFRKILWEILHRDYLNGKRSGRVVKSKKKVSSKKDMKVSANQKEMKKTTQRLSCNINYDALKKAMEDEAEEKSTGNQIGGDNEYDVNDDDNHENGDDFGF